MKKLIAIVLTIICVLALVGCSNKNMTFNIGEASKINIKSGLTGHEVDVTDSETIQNITQDINDLRFEKTSKMDGEVGYAYMLEWFDADGKQIASITITDENGYQIIHDGYYYKVGADLCIDVELFDKLLDRDKLIYGEKQEPSDDDIVYGEGQPLDNEGISKEKAEEIAIEQCKVNYDYIKTAFEASEERWVVEFWENLAKDVPTQTILIDTEGNVLAISYAE